MKKILLISAVSLVLAVPAFAGLDLTWDGCATGPAAHPSDKTLGCAEDDNNQLFGVFQSPSTIANWTFIDCFVDIQTGGAVLPAFWTFSTPISTGCNSTLFLSDARPAVSLCSALNAWGTAGASGDNAIGYVPAQGGVPNRGRFVTSSFRNATPYTTGGGVIGGTSYYAWDLQLSGNGEAIDGCAGCSTPVTIVWNQANTGGAAAQNGVEAEPIVITNPGIISNCATAGGGSVLCGATPVQNKTWGALKSLYR